MDKKTIKYPPRLALARIPTPLEPLRFTQVPAGAQIYLKRDDLTGAATTGNKIRKLEFLLADAKAHGADTVITCGGVQSNHARSTAIAAAAAGMKSVLFLRGSADATNEANLFLNHVVGAELRFLGADEYIHRRDEIMAEYARELATHHRTAYVICEGGSNAIGTWGYVRALEEIHRQAQKLHLRVSGIVAAVGSGGTHSGLLLGSKLLQWKVPVYGINICDDRAFFESRIHAEVQATIDKYRLRVKVRREDVRIIDGYVGDGYGLAPMPVHDLIQCLAAETGVILEPVYTGKAFYGLVQEIGKGAFGKRPTVVFVHTGGIFGLLTQKFASFYRR